jgi:hypothetical protein
MRTAGILVSLTLILVTSSAHAQDAAHASSPALPGGAPAGSPPPPSRSPYTLPFTLRPAIAPRVVRLDTMLGVDADGVALAPVLTVAVPVIPDLAPMVRVGMASSFPNAGGDRSVFLGPLVGALYTPDVGHGLRPSFFVGVALPLGSGSGTPAPRDDGAALAAGRRARASMDNPLFATNYTMLVAGAGLAWLFEGLTLQLDLTAAYGVGSRAPVADPYDDCANVNVQLWAAYAITPWLALGLELRHQHFVDLPAAIAAQQAASPTMPQQEHQTSLAGGVRFRIPIAPGVVLPMGISYARGLNGWMWGRDANVVQLDLPLVF